MVKIGKGKLVDNKNFKVKELLMYYIEMTDNPEELAGYFNYWDPKSLNDTRKLMIEQYPADRHLLITLTNNLFKEIIKEIIEQEESILANHIKDLVLYNSEFLQNLRDARAEACINKLREVYKQQHQMTQCGIKKGIYLLKEEQVFELIDEL